MTATKLQFVGVVGTGALPLPEGWPAGDHTEDDDAVTEEKLSLRVHGKPMYVKLSGSGIEPLFNASKDPDTRGHRDISTEIGEPGSVQRAEAIQAGRPDPLSAKKAPPSASSSSTTKTETGLEKKPD